MHKKTVNLRHFVPKVYKFKDDCPYKTGGGVIKYVCRYNIS